MQTEPSMASVDPDAHSAPACPRREGRGPAGGPAGAGGAESSFSGKETGQGTQTGAECPLKWAGKGEKWVHVGCAREGCHRRVVGVTL